MSRPAAILYLFILLPGALAAAEDWIGLEEEDLPILIGLDLGQDEAGDSNAAISVSLPLGQNAGYDGYYSSTQLSDDDQEFDSLVLASSVWFQLTELLGLEVQHFFEGNESELEKETLGIALDLTQGAWNFRLQLDDGELLIFTRDDATDFLNSLIPDRLESDVSAYRLALGWQAEQWYWQTSYQEFDYDADLTRLDQSRFLQFVIKPSALAQSSLLIERNTSLLVGHADLDDDFSVLISQDRSAIDESYDEYLVLNWQRWASKNFGYLLAASFPLPADEIGLTLGLRWLL